MAEGFPCGEVGEELVEEVVRCEDTRRRGRLLGYLRLARVEEVKGLRGMVELLLGPYCGLRGRVWRPRGAGADAVLWHCLEIAKRNGMGVGGMAEGERLMIHERTGLAMVRVPKGKFLMGSKGGFRDEKPVREVELTEDYWLSKHAVTCWDWARYMRERGGDEPEYWEEGMHHGWHRPVVGVSWDDAKGYCEWGGLRLPSEAEWERAARGGHGVRGGDWSSEGGEAGLGEFAWYGEDDRDAGSHGVGLLAANGYGLSDMLGNVWEWCGDWHGAYDPGDRVDPKGAREGSYCVNRGGSWFNVAKCCRAAHRDGTRPVTRYDLLGFRPSAAREG